MQFTQQGEDGFSRVRPYGIPYGARFGVSEVISHPFYGAKPLKMARPRHNFGVTILAMFHRFFAEQYSEPRGERNESWIRPPFVHARI